MEQKKSKWTHPGNLILFGFLGMLVFISYLVYKSTQIDFQMTRKDYYEEEFEYNGKMLAEKNALPFKDEFIITRGPDQLMISIPKQLSSNLQEGSINFYCPSDASQDKKIILESSADGHYSISTGDWKKTSYRAQFNLFNTGRQYYIELPVTL